MTINEFMTKDHRACDEEFANLEMLVDKSDYNTAKEAFAAFKNHMLHHFEMEESVMFAEFNEHAAGGCNPTGVMVMEHDQMRGVFHQMQAALEQENKEKFLGLCENLLFIMGQHNMKEEQMMYNLADSTLDAQATIEKMQEIV
ncbi:MAG: hemerythrin domain-containing protein [Campylobacterota bacterium]